jgi:xanthine dehydrogenase molybdopterin-binding subunit B
MLAIACWHALREAVKAARKDEDGPTLLDAPATIENVLKAIHA